MNDKCPHCGLVILNEEAETVTVEGRRRHQDCWDTAQRSRAGWIVLRRNGTQAGLFYSREEAEPYLNPGDTLLPVKHTRKLDPIKASAEQRAEIEHELLATGKHVTWDDYDRAITELNNVRDERNALRTAFQRDLQGLRDEVERLTHAEQADVGEVDLASYQRDLRNLRTQLRDSIDHGVTMSKERNEALEQLARWKSLLTKRAEHLTERAERAEDVIEEMQVALNDRQIVLDQSLEACHVEIKQLRDTLVTAHRILVTGKPDNARALIQNVLDRTEKVVHTYDSDCGPTHD